MVDISMKQKLVNSVLALYKEFHTLYGPYVRKDGRKIVVLYDGHRRSARQLAKVLLEVKLGRRLLSGEEVDHKDGDFTNDSPQNLQLLSVTANRIKQHRDIHGLEVNHFCRNCGDFIKVTFSKRCIRKYCSNSCRSTHLGSNQYGNKLTGYLR